MARGQGQEQPFPGQTLSRLRTGMLKAKAKDQGHKYKCSQKKKELRSSKQFLRRSPKKIKKRSSKIFLGDHQKKRSRKKFFSRSTKF